MLRLQRFAVAFCGTSSHPRLVALIAQDEIVSAGGQVEPPGMHMIYLPYSDDVRHIEEFHSESNVSVPRATDGQIKKAADLINRIDLKDFSVCQFANPALQRHYATLQALALEEDEIPDCKDETLPDEEGMARPRVVKAIEEFKLSVYGDKYDEESSSMGNGKANEASRKRKAAAENAANESANYDWADLADNHFFLFLLLSFHHRTTMAGALSSITRGNPISHLAFSTSNPKHQLLSRRFTALAMSRSDHSYWSSVHSEIDTHLEQAIPIKPPLVVYEPMHHLAFDAPQTSAPALCIAACELVGGHRDQAMAAASALRLMHASAFIHKNLPLNHRPGTRLTFDRTFGPNIELLTADGMIPFGLELLARSDDPDQNNSDRVLQAIVEISHAMGSQGVMEGLYNELEHDKSDGEEGFPVWWLHNVCRKKEGTLHACAGACGAILGGGSEEEIEKLRSYGRYVGMVQGIFNRFGGNACAWKEVKELRDLALKELKDFDQAKVRTISRLVETKVL